MTTKKARIREAILARLDVHERDGTLPTTSRFIFYELEARGLVTKAPPDDGRPNRRRNIGWPPGSQDIADELTALRDEGVIPWSWVAHTETNRCRVHSRGDRTRLRAAAYPRHRSRHRQLRALACV